MLHVVNQLANHQPALVVYPQGLLMETRILSGVEAHVPTQTGTVTHGGELTWAVHSK